MAEMIDLQVGARTFRTTRETLTRSEASYFCGFLSDRFTVPRVRKVLSISSALLLLTVLLLF